MFKCKVGTFVIRKSISNGPNGTFYSYILRPDKHNIKKDKRLSITSEKELWLPLYIRLCT